MSRCKSITAKGSQCKRNALPRRRYCWQHESRLFKVTVSGIVGAVVVIIGFWSDLVGLGLNLPVFSDDAVTVQAPASQTPSQGTTFDYQIRITSAHNNQGIAGAEISIGVGGRILRDTTGSDGLAIIQVPDRFVEDTGELVVEATGYQAKSLSITLLRSVRLPVSLEPMPTTSLRDSETLTPPATVIMTTRAPSPTPTSASTSAPEVAVSPTVNSREQPLIAFVSDFEGQPELYVMTVDQKTIFRRLTFDDGEEQHPEWSPDGSQIAYASDVDETFNKDLDIYVIDADGSNRKQLTQNWYHDDAPTWSPSGDELAYHAYPEGMEDTDLFIIDLEKTDEFTLFPVGEADERQPAWSPDGERMAFMSNRLGNWEIYVKDVNGPNERNLTRSQWDDIGPAWAPDGSKIAFASRRDGNWEIYVMNADGTDPQNLTNDPGDDWMPAWSANGEQIIFSSDRSGNYELFLMENDGSSLTQITDNFRSDRYPDVQP